MHTISRICDAIKRATKVTHPPPLGTDRLYRLIWGRKEQGSKRVKIVPADRPIVLDGTLGTPTHCLIVEIPQRKLKLWLRGFLFDRDPIVSAKIKADYIADRQLRDRIVEWVVERYRLNDLINWCEHSLNSGRIVTLAYRGTFGCPFFCVRTSQAAD